MLLKALLLQCLYSVRRERQLAERLDTDRLFRWFCGLDPTAPVFDATAFTPERPRLDAHGVTPHTAMRSGPAGGAKNTSMRLVKNRLLIAARRRMKRRTQGEPCRRSRRAGRKVGEIFGWCKTVAGVGRARHVGRGKIKKQLEMAAAAYNLVRLRNLMGA